QGMTRGCYQAREAPAIAGAVSRAARSLRGGCYRARMRSWAVLTVTAAPALVEAVESFLLDHGAPGLQTEETPAGVHVVAHFADAAPLAELDAWLDALRGVFPDPPRPGGT